MEVRLEPHIGRNVVSGEKVRCPQYLIYVDGKHVGFMPFADGARPLLFVQLGPIELVELKSEIRNLMPPGHLVRDARTAPQQPEPEPENEFNASDAFGFR